MKKYWELAELENEVFLRRPFWIFKSAILKFFFASSHLKRQPVYMRYHFLLQYGWFFQNLRKEAVRTFMHTTVNHVEFIQYKSCVGSPWVSLMVSMYFRVIREMTPIFGLASLSGKLPSPGEPKWVEAMADVTINRNVYEKCSQHYGWVGLKLCF